MVRKYGSQNVPHWLGLVTKIVAMHSPNITSVKPIIYKQFSFA